MRVSSRFGSVSLCVLWGLLAFVAAMAAAIFSTDIRLLAFVAFVAFSAATFHRAGNQPANLIGTTLAVALGGIVPAVLLNRLRLALTSPHETFIILFLITSLLGAATGLLLRMLSKAEKTLLAVALGCIALIAVGVAILKLVPMWIENQAYNAVNQEIAPFHIQTLAGKRITSEELKGHIVVLSFWATWCPPCQGELPEIDAVAKHYSGNQKILVLAVNSGTGGDDAEKAGAYLLKKALGVTGAIDSLDGHSWGPAAKSVGVPFLPAIYILDRSGRVRVIHYGYDGSENLKESLTQQIDRL